MGGEVCKEHAQNMACISDLGKNLALLQKDIEYLRRDQETILARFGKHVEDAEKPGGRHERLKAVEDDLKATKIIGRWFMIGSGIIGGLIGSGSAKAVTQFLGMFR